MLTDKNTAFLPMQYGFKLDRQRVKNKTDLFRIISVYITTEVYFGYAINYCEADRLKLVPQDE